MEGAEFESGTRLEQNQVQLGYLWETQWSRAHPNSVLDAIEIPQMNYLAGYCKTMSPL